MQTTNNFNDKCNSYAKRRKPKNLKLNYKIVQVKPDKAEKTEVKKCTK